MRKGEGKFYLDKYNGKLLGVCAGIADFTGIGAIWIRLALVLGTLFTATFPIAILIYFLVALIVPKKPIHLYREDYGAIFGNSQEFRRTKRKEKP